MSTVLVRSLMPNAVELRLHDMIDEGGIEGAFCPNPAGIPTAVLKDSRVVQPGVNEVDEDFWRAYAKQATEHGLIASGMLREEKEEKADG